MRALLQLTALKEHHRITLGEHSQRAAQWALEKADLEEQLHVRIMQLADAKTEVSKLPAVCPGRVPRARVEREG